MPKYININKFMRSKGFMLCCALVALGGYTACKKTTDPAPVDDDRLNRPYCNDPEAVNYNWNFPGKPDSTVCYYPSDLFSGNWQYSDSIMSADGTSVLDSAQYLLTFSKTGNKSMLMKGLCNTKTLNITAFRAQIFSIDTVVALGQYLCDNTDTIAGAGSMYFNENGRFSFSWILNSDTGISYHHGTAVKQ